MPDSTLKTSLDALIESLVDSVLGAIRRTSLEELLGERLPTRRPEIAESARKLARESVRPPTRRGVRAKPQTATVVAQPGDHPSPEPAVEITDPQLLLGLGTPLPPIDPDANPPPESEEPASHPRMRLREHETLARVSNAGVVIRRGKR